MTATQNTDDIWNFLPRRYPSRRDRDSLVTRAQLDPTYQRRVEIWDFFFRVDRKSLLAPLQTAKDERVDHRSKLQEELVQQETRIYKKIELLREQALEAKSAWEKWSAGLHDSLKREIDGNSYLLKTIGIGLLLAGGLFLLMGLTAAIAEKAFFASVCIVFSILFALPGFIMLFTGTTMEDSVDSKLVNARASELENLTKYLAKLSQEETHLTSLLETKRAAAAAKLASIMEDIHTLDARIESRARQIPKIPDLERIHAWLQEDLDEMEEDLVRESGQEGLLAKTRLQKNIFCIRGPAELQDKNQIEEIYLTDEDLRKHLRAKFAGTDSAGYVIDLYGVWAIEFLLVGQYELTSARVFYDFITKRKSVQFRTHPYNAVALVENGSHFRKISAFSEGSSSEEIIDNVPSMSFGLENGQTIEVSFPNPNYIREVFPGLNPEKRSYDPWQEAKEVIALMRRNVHDARTQGASRPVGGDLEDL